MTAFNTLSQVAPAVSPTDPTSAITVVIYNWNCYNQKKLFALTADPNNLVVLDTVAEAGPTDRQKWTLIPNLVPGAASGGFTLFNQGAQLPAEQPAPGQQILLGDDPTPFGSTHYCWTLFWAASDGGQQQWSIETFDRKTVMDAFHSACADNTQVILHDSNKHNNQRWVIQQTN